MIATKIDSAKFACSGQHYVTTVPDTLDLADRAELALNAIGNTIDPTLHYNMFFHVYCGCRTPYMSHHNADVGIAPKHGEVIPLLRLMCGSDQHQDIEAGHRDDLLSRLEDGLYWRRHDPAYHLELRRQPRLSSQKRENRLSPPIFFT